MAVQIFQTAVLLLFIFLVIVHVIDPDCISTSVAWVLIIGLFLSLVTTFVSTVILIWT